MTSTLERPARIELGAQRARVRALPSGSKPRLIGALWLAWLEHIRRCQKEGLAAATSKCTRHRGLIIALDAAFPQWDCCVTHRDLKAERQRLLDFAKRLHTQPAPHQSDEPLSSAWWLERGYRFNVRTTIVD